MAAALVAAALLTGCSSWDVPVPLHALVHNNTNRDYRLHIPEAVRDKNEAAPLVLVLQGAGAVPDVVDVTHMTEVADREGFVVAFPAPVGDLWNDGALAVLGPNASSDVAFLRRVVADIDEKRIRIDRHRIYAIGISNGGMMSLRLACEAADLFAGVGAVAASMPKTLAATCHPQAPVSVIVINGTADPIIPYRGGDVRVLRVMRFGEVASTDETMALWARLNGCGPAASPLPLPDRDTSDASRVWQIDYTGCRGARLRLLRVDGGGHTWPGGLQFLPAAWVGPVNRDIDAGQAAWAFFKQASRH